MNAVNFVLCAATIAIAILGLALVEWPAVVM